jgi:HSP20 family protein
MASSLLPRPRALFPGLQELFEGPWPFGEHNLVRIEDTMSNGNYVVRAELPGFDPEKQIHVTTNAGLLTISAEREEKTKEKGHSEFRYGSFTRTVALPEGADTSKIAAKYADGILEITVPVKEAETGTPVHIETKG